MTTSPGPVHETAATTDDAALTFRGVDHVSLTVTDSLGKSATTSTTLTVTAPVVAPAATSGGGGGGGGAMELGWLLGWLASVIGVWAVTPRSRRR